ncbi:MAG TPA: hypothetical protein VIJ75_05055 [Hanamia sp.]
MKQLFKMQLTVVVIFTLNFSSCSKKDSTPKPDSQTLLIGKIWKITEKAEDENKNGKLEANEYHALDANTIGEITLSTGGVGNEMFRGDWALQWSLLDDQNMKVNINYINGSEFFNWHIVKLTDTEFDFVETTYTDKVITFGFHCTPK